MQKKQTEAELLKKIPHPAFFVNKGIITTANQKAANLKIKAGTPIDTLLRTGNEEYLTFTGGRLCLSLFANNILYDASVIKYHNLDLFYIEAEFFNPELFMMAATAQTLTDPLSCAMTSMYLLQNDPATKDNPALASLNRHLYRLYKAISDMSDAANYGKMRESRMTDCELRTEIGNIVTKASALLKETNHRLEYKCDMADEFYGCIDREKIERLTLTLISDMLLFCKKRAPLKINLSKKKDRILLTFRGRITEAQLKEVEDLFFSCHSIPDGLDAKSGVFNGAIIARNAITSHFGTMLIDSPRTSTIRFTFTIPIQQSGTLNLHSHVDFPEDYSGGYDHHLIALSDVLPDELYK